VPQKGIAGGDTTEINEMKKINFLNNTGQPSSKEDSPLLLATGSGELHALRLYTGDFTEACFHKNTAVTIVIVAGYAYMPYGPARIENGELTWLGHGVTENLKPGDCVTVPPCVAYQLINNGNELRTGEVEHSPLVYLVLGADLETDRQPMRDHPVIRDQLSRLYARMRDLADRANCAVR
jgi:mannose-6-phosphate isomerase-like protein (cupin superfamily)